MDLRERWGRTWRAADLAPPLGLFERLQAGYREPHRHYHTDRHLEECFEAGDLLCATPDVELALWFHDAIYDTARHDNEARSAAWARKSISDPERGARVHDLILATRHDALPASQEERIVVDVDLSILGAMPARFDEYERQIRREYRWVPAPLYRRKRAAILRGFLDREAIYTTPLMHRRLESQARENLARSLASG